MNQANIIYDNYFYFLDFLLHISFGIWFACWFRSASLDFAGGDWDKRGDELERVMGEKKIWCGENRVKLCALLDLMAKKWLVHGGKIYYFPMLNATFPQFLYLDY
jgi:hypothetical protein